MAFTSPDEALTRRAIERVALTGTPVVPLAFDDPVGAQHQRLWIPLNGVEVPSHPPFLFFLYGNLEKLLPGSGFAPYLMVAAGLGAFVAGISTQLPRAKWLSLAFPGLMFPATYRMLRPWTNIAAMLSFVGLAVLFLGLFMRGRKRHWLYLYFVSVALAASIRPDQIHLVLGLSLIATLWISEGGRERVWYVVWHSLMGLVVVMTVLLGNQMLTGDPFVSAINYLETSRGGRFFGTSLPTPLRQIALITMPLGMPNPRVVWFQAQKYLWEMGPILVISGTAILALAWGVLRMARAGRRGDLAALLGATALLASFFAFRSSSLSLHGADAAAASIGHSIPRYNALLFAALGALVLGFVTANKARLAALVGSGVVIVGGVLGLHHVLYGDPTASLVWYRVNLPVIEEQTETLSASLPENAVLYVKTIDKYIWNLEPVAIMPTERVDDPESREAAELLHIRYKPLLTSLTAAVEAGYTPLLIELTGEEVLLLSEALPRDSGFMIDRHARLDHWQPWEVWVVRRA